MKLKKLKEKMPKSFKEWFVYFVIFLGFLPLFIIAFFLVASPVRSLFLPKEVKLYEKGMSSIADYERVEALKYFNEALEIDPDYWIVYRDRSQIYLKMARYDDAISDLTRAIELNPTSSKSYYYRGNVYFELEEYEKAIEDYSAAISIVPEYGLYYNARGDAYKKIGNIEKAREDFHKGCELGDYSSCDSLKSIILKEKMEGKFEIEK
jgi:tetratricopeptide (TPR) repeat protein